MRQGEEFVRYAKALWTAGDYDVLHSLLVDRVTKHYWMYAGELYILFGNIGCGAGFSDWDERRLYPKPKANAASMLDVFLPNLSGAHHVLTPTAAEKKAVRYLEERRKQEGDVALWIPYQQILRTKSDYEIGAGRIFTELIGTAGWKRGLYGLLRILTSGLKESRIKAEMIKRKYQKAAVDIVVATMSVRREVYASN